MVGFTSCYSQLDGPCNEIVPYMMITVCVDIILLYLFCVHVNESMCSYKCKCIYT